MRTHKRLSELASECRKPAGSSVSAATLGLLPEDFNSFTCANAVLVCSG